MGGFLVKSKYSNDCESGSVDKFEDEYEISGSGSGQVRLVCQGLHFSPVIS